MITKSDLVKYPGEIISGNENYSYILPDRLLRPYIAHYCLTFPTPETMPEEYTILPSANAVLSAIVNNGRIDVFLSGTNTKAEVVGGIINTCDILLLVKFRVGGFFCFHNFEQNELTDISLDLRDMDKALAHEMEITLIKSESAADLIGRLNEIFLKRLNYGINGYVNAALKRIVVQKGAVTSHELSDEYHYSEKHMRRLFLGQLGVSPKKLSQIVRINHVLWLLQDTSPNLARIAANAGFFDQSHLYRDFRTFFNSTPNDYIKDMSVFYNTDAY